MKGDKDNGDNFIPAYDGNDMISYIMKIGFKLYGEVESIKSITNVRDTAIIVTDHRVYRVRPQHRTGFCIETLVHI